MTKLPIPKRYSEVISSHRFSEMWSRAKHNVHFSRQKWRRKKDVG